MSSPPSNLSTRDHAFLGFVARGARTAYEIKRAMSASISYFWTAAHSQVYQQASRLVRDGYIAERPAPGARRKRLLSLTPKGRRALRRWLQQPAAPPELRDETLVKVFFAEQGTPAATLGILEDQRARHRERLAEYERIRDALERAEGDVALLGLDTLRLGHRVERAYLDWLDETISRLGHGPG